MGGLALAFVYGILSSLVFLFLYLPLKKGKIILGNRILLKEETPIYFYIFYSVFSFIIVCFFSFITYLFITYYPNMIYISVIVGVITLFSIVKIMQNKTAKKRAYESILFLNKVLIIFFNLYICFLIGLVLFSFLFMISNNVFLSLAISFLISSILFLIFYKNPFFLKLFLKKRF